MGELSQSLGQPVKEYGRVPVRGLNNLPDLIIVNSLIGGRPHSGNKALDLAVTVLAAILAVLVVPARFHCCDCLSAYRHGGFSTMDLIGMLPGGSLDTFPSPQW